MKRILPVIFALVSAFGLSCKRASSCGPCEYFAAASDLLEAGEYGASIEAAEKAADLFRDFSAHENGEAFYYDCLTIIGEAHLRSGDAKKAQEQFEMTFGLAHENEDVLLGIAAVYFRLQKYQEAKSFFGSCMERFKENPAAAEALRPYYEEVTSRL